MSAPNSGHPTTATGGSRSIPITVLGGYLGAGKTTLLNRLLANPGGRRLGVIVNDFGSLAIDVELLRQANADDPAGGIVSLPNGCVCCSLGGDLYEALSMMTSRDAPPDHIVIEASGVADPTVAAAWGTSDGFEPGGVIVLASADSIRRQARDKYVGGEVRRQLAGADLIVVTKTDLCEQPALDSVDAWLDIEAPGIARIAATHGDVPIEIILGIRPGEVLADPPPGDEQSAHTEQYVSWSWTGGQVDNRVIERLLDNLPAGLLRLKGVIEREDGSHVGLQVVGANGYQWGLTPEVVAGSRLVAIGIRDVFDPDLLDRLFR